MRSHVFVGREAALAFLRQRHYRATCGEGGAVFLTGEAGIGKTRLCAEFEKSIASEDPHVVVTRAVDYASSPFAPIVEAVETWSAKRPHLFDVQVGLRETVGAITRADTEGRAPTAGERRRCFDGIARLFRIACADAPTTLLIDDVHEADPATLQLLAHVLAATRHSAFLLVATMRPIELVSAERRPDLGRLLRESNAEVFSVGALADAAVRELVLDASATRLDRSVRAEIVKRAAGNPLFAEELARQALTAGGAPSHIPMSISEIAVERLERLSTRERSLLTFAAVIGVEFSGAFLATITETAPAIAYASIRAGIVLGLIEETDDADVFRFRHALTREAVYAQPLEIERRDMHRRVFESMRSTPYSWSIGAIAYHAAAAKDAAATAYYGELAGDQAVANRAAEAASVYYEQALSTCDHEATARLCEKLASARLVAGFPDLAESPGRRLLRERLEAGDTTGAVDAYLLLTEIAAHCGADDSRLATFAQMRELLVSASDSKLEPFRMLCDAELAFAEEDMESVVSISAVPAALAAPDLRVAIAIANARAHALLFQHRYRRAIASQTIAVRRAVRERDPELETATRMNLGVVSILSGDVERAARSFRGAAAIAEKRVATTERALGLAMQAEVELIRGNNALARRLLDESIADAGQSDHPGVLIFAGRVGIWIGVREDDPEISRHIVDVLDLERVMLGPGNERLHPLAGAFARHLISVGREEEGQAVLRRAIARLRTAKRFRITDWSVCSMMTVAEIGHPDDIPLARRPLVASNAPYTAAFTELFDATVAARYGDPEAARRFAERSVDGFLKYDFIFEAAIALALSGRKREALDIAEKYHYVALARQFANDLRVTNRQGRAAKELTKREHEVARLVEQGCSNRTIAERLSVSEKTVETHLSSIFAKLHVRSRAEITASGVVSPSLHA